MFGSYYRRCGGSACSGAFISLCILLAALSCTHWDERVSDSSWSSPAWGSAGRSGVVLVEAGIVPVESEDPLTPSPQGPIQAELRSRVLVLGDTDDVKSKTHGIFLGMLQAKGFETVFRTFNDPSVKLKLYGDFLYDYMVIIDSANFGSKPVEGGQFKGFTLVELLEFVDSGGSVFVATGPSAGGTLRRFANEVGVDFDKPQSYVMDHFSPYASLNERHSVIASTDMIKGTPIIGKSVTSPVVYEGIGHLVNPSNSLTIPILRAASTSYCSAASTTSGKDILLVSAMQGRNSARVTISGSASFLSDAFFKISEGNKQFISDVIDWAFQRTGVLRWSNLKHHKMGETVSPRMYRVKDYMSFSIDVHELQNGFWVPYNKSDLQVEFTMLDPHIRAFLEPPKEQGSPTFSLNFRAPDRYGVFKFVVQHLRMGYNELNVESLAPLRNFKHNDYDRFLPCAFPYYGSAMCSIIGVFLFSLIFLYQSDTAKVMGTGAVQADLRHDARGGADSRSGKASMEDVRRRHQEGMGKTYVE